MMPVKFSPLALEQFFSVEESNKRLFRGLKKMITDTQRNGTGGLGHPEALSGNLAGWWSKQIDDANEDLFASAPDKNIRGACVCASVGGRVTWPRAALA
jgi:toxin YoeB